jgi:hypothetical protein
MRARRHDGEKCMRVVTVMGPDPEMPGVTGFRWVVGAEGFEPPTFSL